MNAGIPVLKMVMMGSAGAGKTWLVHRWTHSEKPPNKAATVGLDMEIRVLNIGDRSYKVHVYDTAGQERFHSIVCNYYRGTYGAVCVVDVPALVEACEVPPADNQTRDEQIVAAILPQLRSIDDCRRMCAHTIAPRICVFGNKVDQRPGNETAYDEIRDALSVIATQQYQAVYFDTSALNGEGVDVAFMYLAGEMVDIRRQMLDLSPQLPTNGFVQVTSTPAKSPSTTTTCAC